MIKLSINIKKLGELEMRDNNDIWFEKQNKKCWRRALIAIIIMYIIANYLAYRMYFR